MWWTRCERRRRRGGRGGACCGRHGADDQDGVDGAALDGERVEQCADGAAPSRTPALGKQAQASQSQTSRRLAEPAGVLVPVVSTSRLVLVAEMSRARWPSSPTSRICGCLYRGSNAQAVSKQARRALARAGGQRKWRHASRRVRFYGVGQARERTSRARGLVRVRVQHAHRPRARSGRADRSCAACVAAGRSGGRTCGWWVGILGL
jgi:hypothetical protein